MTPKTAVGAKSQHCSLYHKKLSHPAAAAQLTELFSRLPAATILGANTAAAKTCRFSYWMAQPVKIFQFHAGRKNPFEKLQNALTTYTLPPASRSNLPTGMFCGGWAGYFGYELAGYVENLPNTTTDDLQMPLIRLAFYDRLIACDHLENQYYLLALQTDTDTQSPQQKLDQLRQFLNDAQRLHLKTPPAFNINRLDFSSVGSNITRTQYFQALNTIKHYIYDGQVYQVNFSQRFQLPCRARAIDLFHWQNHYNPSPYAAYIDAGNFAIVSASPEMFITITNRLIRTKPIKGTRPRIKSSDTSTRRVNRQNYLQLLGSEKEKAELNMIIDLERNDLGRICQYGSIHPVQPRSIETYPTVFHAVATIQGRLRPEVTFPDILKAMFPGGSITGAPKVSAMEIIDRLEPTARAVYTGAIGFIGLNHDACLNIAIRTVIITRNKAFAQVGGGIVADSQPAAEWNETLTKANALLAGIKAVQNH